LHRHDAVIAEDKLANTRVPASKQVVIRVAVVDFDRHAAGSPMRDAHGFHLRVLWRGSEARPDDAARLPVASSYAWWRGIIKPELEQLIRVDVPFADPGGIGQTVGDAAERNFRDEPQLSGRARVGNCFVGAQNRAAQIRGPAFE